MAFSSASRSNRPADIDTSKKFVELAPGTSSPTTPGRALSASGGDEPLETPMTDVFNDADVSDLSSVEESLLRDKEVRKTDKVAVEVITKRADTLQVKSKDTKAAGEGSLKRSTSASESSTNKRAKSEEAEIELNTDGSVKLHYQSIKAIKMPPRKHTGPPTENEEPYGSTENYQNSMIIYWLDEMDKSYNETCRLYAKKFPQHKSVEEAIRRRHIRSLGRLAKKYGVKQLHEIDGVGKHTLRRGKKRTPRQSKGSAKPPLIAAGNTHLDVAAPVVPAAPAAPVAPADPPKVFNFNHAPQAPKYVRNSYKVAEKIAIVVWRDLDHLDFKDIRERLEDKYDWSLGKATVEKYYHLTRPKVYGALTSNAEGTAAQAEQDIEADEAYEKFDGDESIVEDV
jgi:hypothetical protein